MSLVYIKNWADESFAIKSIAFPAPILGNATWTEILVDGVSNTWNASGQSVRVLMARARFRLRIAVRPPSWSTQDIADSKFRPNVQILLHNVIEVVSRGVGGTSADTLSDKKKEIHVCGKII